MLSVLALQWQLIGRIDDMMKLEKSFISFNHEYIFTLLCKMTWSKNICEERESPTQLMLPAIYPLFCPLLNLEIFFGKSCKCWIAFYGEHLNRSVDNILENILSSKHFTVICPGSLGTHGIRKGLQPMQAFLGFFEIE